MAAMRNRMEKREREEAVEKIGIYICVTLIAFL
jgi:hypothetical protein